ncbi:MAG TPA: YIP1 family protein [Opitutales bacterium]|nr:YIP1 family protein [Opitutales bacterium]
MERFACCKDMTESSSSSPLITLWYKPGRTLQGLIASGKGRSGALAIAVLFGLVQVWPTYSAREASGAGFLLLGVAAAVAGLYLFGWLLRNFGRWFGGTAALVDVRTALGWGLLPWTAFFGLLLVLVTTTKAEAGQLFPLFFAAILYGFVILLYALSTALRLSFMKTFFCMLLTFLVSIFPLTFILQLFLVVPGANAP